MLQCCAQVTNLKVNGHIKRTFAFTVISVISRFYILEDLEIVLGLEFQFQGQGLSQISGQGQGIGLHYQVQGQGLTSLPNASFLVCFICSEYVGRDVREYP